MLPEEHHDTADEEDHGQKEAKETDKPTHTHINRATSTSTSTPRHGQRSSLPCRVHTIEALLATITTPPQNPTQELEHAGCIKKILELTLEANTNLPDVGALELAAFKTSFADNSRKAAKNSRISKTDQLETL